MMDELLYKTYKLIFNTILEPIIDFNKKAKKYKKKKEYGKIAIVFLLSLLYELAILFDLAAIIFLIIYFANNHIGVVCVCSTIIFLYWLVKVKYVDKPQEQEKAVVEDKAYEELKKYAQNGYRDMRLIVFRVVQTVGEALGMKHSRMLTDIESNIEKFFIKNGAVYYIFDIKKEDINQKYTEEELDDAKNILENTFMELWHKGTFPNIQMSTYTDNGGVILPPVTFVLLSDMGTYFELYVTFTSPASVDFIKSAKQEKNATNNGYDNDDSRLL